MKKILLISAISAALAGPAYAIALDPLTPEQRHAQAYTFREARAAANEINPPAVHPTNSDETSVPDFQGQYHKALPHNASGVVNASIYNQLLSATGTGTFAAFEALPLTGSVKLANPLGAQVYDLEGRDSHDYGTRAAPSVSSAETAGEMVEDYYHALTRDLTFKNYSANPIIIAAATEMTGLSDFHGPTTPANLFRGIWEGEETGPYISQFLYKDIPYGRKVVNQKYNGYQAGVNFMTTPSEWLAIQNGTNPTAAVTTTAERYMVTGRDLAAYVHKDFTYQAFQNAALILLGMGNSVIDDGNPYKTATKQGAFIDQGGPEILDMVARAGNAGLRAAWFQKWNVHRRLRPEAYGGLAINNPSILHSEFKTSNAVAAVNLLYGNKLLPMAYPEGSPTHPAYPAGHATISGACATILKAFFKEDALIPSPIQPNNTGSALTTYPGNLTVGGEINKLASNISIGRDWAGVHFRSDGTDGMLLGEEVGISILKDWKEAHPEQPALTIKKFNGDIIEI
jgi:hypothetical protein